MELFKELIELSLKEKRGLTFYIKGQTIAGIVTEVIGTEAIEVRNQSFSKVIIRIAASDAVAINRRQKRFETGLTKAERHI